MQWTLKCLHVIKATQGLTIQRLNIKILKNSHVAIKQKGGGEPVDEATCFSYVVPKTFASPLIVHINDNKFLIAIVYLLYSFSFKLPLTVFINAHGCLITRLLFFPSLDLPHFLCLEIPPINMPCSAHAHTHPRIFKTLPRDILWSNFGSSLSMQLELISTLTVIM